MLRNRRTCVPVLVIVSAMVAAPCVLAAAVPGASSPAVTPATGTSIVGSDVLLVETNSTALGTALNDLGVVHDVIATSDFSSIDFSPYLSVLIGMDGGGPDDGDVAAVRTGVVDAGKRLCWFGGSSLTSFAQAMNDHLVPNNVANSSWVISSTPHLTITDAGHPLAQGLPASTDFVDESAAFYMLRVTDPDIQVAGQNGDGFDSLFAKLTNFPGGGSGEMVYFIDSPLDSYWTNPADAAILETIVDNCLAAQVPVELMGFEVE